MQLRIDDVSYNVCIGIPQSEINATPVIFLHGFMGSCADWDFIINKLPQGFNLITIDLIGHGKTDSPVNVYEYSTKTMVRQLLKIIRYFKISRAIIAGYSLGGRAALSLAVRYPELVEALILESITPGIENKNERFERVNSDKLLAKKIEDEGIENFVNYWINIPLFDTLKILSDSKLSQIRESKLNNSIIGLANMLRGFGTGRMPSCWAKLHLIKSPVLLITGALDIKFTEINSRALQLFPDAAHKVVPACGHNVHLEKPGEFIIFVNDFLNRIRN